MRTTLLASVAATALAFAAMPAHATFILDTSCGQSQCAAGTKFYNDAANKDVLSFTGTVGGHSGPAVTVTDPTGVDTGAGFSNIKPTKGTLLTSLTFTPADDTLFSDFSFRNQMERAGFGTGLIDVNWVDSNDNTGTVVFNDEKPDQDSDRLGIVSNDGETLKSVTLVAMDGESFKEVKQVEFSFADTTPAPVPEPAALIPLSAGLLGLGMVRWNRRRS